MEERYRQISFDDYGVPYKFITTKLEKVPRLGDQVKTANCTVDENQVRIKNTLIENK